MNGKCRRSGRLSGLCFQLSIVKNCHNYTAHTSELLRTKITAYVTNGNKNKSHMNWNKREPKGKKRWFHYAVLTVISHFAFSSLPISHIHTLSSHFNGSQTKTHQRFTMTMACQILTVTKVVWQITQQKVATFIESHTLMACHRLTHVFEPIPLANSSCSLFVSVERELRTTLFHFFLHCPQKYIS